MGHSSIKLTADIYGHLIPGADISWIDKLDSNAHQNAPRTHPPVPDEMDAGKEDPQLTETDDLNWWRRLDSNQRPTDYETVALAT